MWEHAGAILPYLIVMLGTLTINHVLSRQQADKRAALETMRFRLALSIEMQALSTLYNDNLDLLNRDAEYVLSTRQSAIVYRGNLGRLTTLDTPVLEQVVAVYAENERIEAFLAANAKSANALSYRIAPGIPETATLKRMFADATSNMKQASAALDDCNVGRQLGDRAKSSVILAQARTVPMPRQVAA